MKRLCTVVLKWVKLIRLQFAVINFVLLSIIANSKRRLRGAGWNWRNRPSGLCAETSIRRWVFKENGRIVRMCFIHCFPGQIRWSRSRSTRPVSFLRQQRMFDVDFLAFRWNVFRTRLFRESCVYHGGNYVKDLNKLGRDLQKIVIVDNSPASYIFHPENAVSVS